MRAPEGTFKSFIATLLIGGVLLTIAATIEVLLMNRRRKYVEPVSDLAIPPGETLEEELIARQMSRYTLSEQMGVPLHVVEGVLKRQEPITPHIAERLDAVLDIGPDFWRRLEQRYRETLKRQDSIYRE